MVNRHMRKYALVESGYCFDYIFTISHRFTELATSLILKVDSDEISLIKVHLLYALVIRDI